MPVCINTPLDTRDRVRDKVPDKVRDKLLDKQLSGKLSERFPSDIQVVSEWFLSGFGVLQTCPQTCPGDCPGFLGPVRGVVGGLSWFVPGFLALKAVRGLSGELSRRFCALQLSGGLSGVCPGGCPKTGVYAEPPLSSNVSLLVFLKEAETFGVAA